MSLSYEQLLENFSSGVEEEVETGQAIHDSTMKIVSHSLNFDVLIKELANWQDQELDSLVSWVSLKIERSKEFATFDIRDVMESLMIQGVKTAVEKRDIASLQRLGRIYQRLESEGYLNTKLLESEFEFPLSSPDVAVGLDEAGIVPLAVQLDLTWKHQEKNVIKFMHEYVEAVKDDRGTKLTALLASIAFHKDSPPPRKKRAHTLIEKMLEKVLEKILQGEESIDLRLISSINVPDSVASQFRLFCLSFAVRHRSKDKLSDVIESHLKLHNKISYEHGIGSLVHGVLQDNILSPQEVCDLVSRVLRRGEVNWTALLTMVTVALRILKGFDELLSCVLREILSEAVHDHNVDAFLSGLVVCRHATLESSPFFPSYPVWFNSNLANTSNQTAMIILTTTDLEFLLDSLSSLVPSEPEYALRAHLAAHFKTTCPNNKMKLETYKQLARTHLLDLTNQNAGPSVNQLDQKILDSAKEYVREWSLTKKIPAQIMEASMFKQPFYQSQLLPALMICSLEEELDGARQQIIQHLNSKGKVPGHLYKDFINGDINSKYNVDPQIDQADSFIGEINVESVKEVLEMLCNLPAEFQEEIETSLANLKMLIFKLSPEKERLIDLGSVKKFDANSPISELVDLVCDYLVKIGIDGGIGTQIAKIATENLGCQKCLLYRMVYGHLNDVEARMSLNLFYDNLDVIEDGTRLKIRDLFTRKQRGIRKVSTLENIFKVYTAADEHNQDVELTNKTSILNLCGLRRAARHVLPFTPNTSAASAKDSIVIQLSLMDDPLEEVYRRQVYMRLLRSAFDSIDSSADTMLTCLELVFHDDDSSIVPEQSIALLSCLVQEDQSLYLSSTASLAASTGNTVATLRAVTALNRYGRLADNLPANDVDSVICLLENCRKDTELLVPFEAVEVLRGVGVGMLPEKLLFSLAHYEAAGLLNFKCMTKLLRSEFPGVYCWYQENDSMPASISIGMFKLGELYLNDEVNIVDEKYESTSQAHTIIQQVKRLIADTSDQDLITMIDDESSANYVSFQISQASKAMLVKILFSMHVPCSLQVIVKLLPYLSTLLDSGTISHAECSVLSRELTLKLDTFSNTEVRQALARLDERKLNSEVFVMLKRYIGK